jgi:tetratricopeptide (TPR) repeat protein
MSHVKPAELSQARGPRALGPALVVLLVLLSGCASQGPTLRSLPAESGPQRAELTSTPFFPQSDYQCGPAALATVLTASGVATSPEALVPKVYLPGRQGSLQLELVAAARQFDRLAYVLEPDLSHLVAEVAAGRPVLVMQNLGVASYPIWHFAVVVGYDRETEQLVLRSGRTERLTMSVRRFLGTWARADRWAMVLLEPGQSPVRPDAVRYMTAAAALEATGRLDAAEAAYAKGRELWPGSALPTLGIANIALTRGDAARAVQAYDEALVSDPDNVAARHNLAEALAGLGCVEAARREAHVALALARDTPLATTVSTTVARLDSQQEPVTTPSVCLSR